MRVHAARPVADTRRLSGARRARYTFVSGGRVAAKRDRKKPSAHAQARRDRVNRLGGACSARRPPHPPVPEAREHAGTVCVSGLSPAEITTINERRDTRAMAAARTGSFRFHDRFAHIDRQTLRRPGNLDTLTNRIRSLGTLNRPLTTSPIRFI